MRHRVAGRGFGRTANHRKALLRNLAISLFDHLKIETTVAKAKETKRLAERIITLGKRGDLHARRLALSHIPNKNSVTKVFTEIAPKIERSSGYLRVIKSRYRKGDNSDMAILEFVDYDLLKADKEEQKEGKKKAKEKAETKEKAKTKGKTEAEEETKSDTEEKKTS